MTSHIYLTAANGRPLVCVYAVCLWKTGHKWVNICVKFDMDGFEHNNIEVMLENILASSYSTSEYIICIFNRFGAFKAGSIEVLLK